MILKQLSAKHTHLISSVNCGPIVFCKSVVDELVNDACVPG